MTGTSTTETIVTRYFTAWTSRDTATVREILAEDYVFEGPGMRVEGRDAFLAGAAFPTDAETELVAQVCQGREAFQLYDSSRAGRSVRIAERLTIDADRITSSQVVTDPAAFQAFLGG